MKMLFPDGGVTGLANDVAFLAILGALFKAGSRVFAVECIKIIFCRLVQAVQNQVESLYVPLSPRSLARSFNDNFRVRRGHMVIAPLRAHADRKTGVFLNGIRAVSERSRPKKNYYDTRRDAAKVMRTVNDDRRDPNRVWPPLLSSDDNRKQRTRANGASFGAYTRLFAVPF
jgi:hypothetical protein